jgi:arsenate reductase
MTQKIYNVLFLCTGNSARSIMAEALLNRLGAGRFTAFSAGSHPAGRVNPLTIEQLERAGYSTAGLRSKDWEEFARPGAPQLDFVFTVCDKAASEICPAWPGQPMTAHWGIEDPAAVQGDEATRRRAFVRAFSVLQRRLSLFLSLPFEKLDAMALQHELSAIGQIAEQVVFPAERRDPPPAAAAARRTVLVLCTGNSCRSQMAEAILRYELADQVRALSAGTAAHSLVADNAIAALRLAQVPVDGLYPKNVEAVMHEPIDLIVTVCDHARETCPIFPRPVPGIHLPFHDPHGEPLESFVRVRDEIRARLLPAVRQALGL